MSIRFISRGAEVLAHVKALAQTKRPTTREAYESFRSSKAIDLMTMAYTMSALRRQGYLERADRWGHPTRAEHIDDVCWSPTAKDPKEDDVHVVRWRSSNEYVGLSGKTTLHVGDARLSEKTPTARDIAASWSAFEAAWTQGLPDYLFEFASRMRYEIDANAHKGEPGSWASANVHHLSNEIVWHLSKLNRAILAGDANGVDEFSADVANMAMMTRDAFRRLNAPSTDPAVWKVGEKIPHKNAEGTQIGWSRLEEDGTVITELWSLREQDEEALALALKPREAKTTSGTVEAMRPPIRTTHTTVDLELSPAAYEEIADAEGRIDMSGIALVREASVPDFRSLEGTTQVIAVPGINTVVVGPNGVRITQGVEGGPTNYTLKLSDVVPDDHLYDSVPNETAGFMAKEIAHRLDLLGSSKPGAPRMGGTNWAGISDARDLRRGVDALKAWAERQGVEVL